MTPKQLRELDAKIAEKVMGWKWVTADWNYNPFIRKRWLEPRVRERRQLADMILTTYFGDDGRVVCQYVRGEKVNQSKEATEREAAEEFYQFYKDNQQDFL